MIAYMQNDYYDIPLSWMIGAYIAIGIGFIITIAFVCFVVWHFGRRR